LAGQVAPQANQNDSETDEPSVSLLDRAVAALILIVPFGILIDWTQGKLLTFFCWLRVVYPKQFITIDAKLLGTNIIVGFNS
jgi:hypothetical protein